MVVVVGAVDWCALARGGWESKKANQLRELGPPPDATGRRFFLWGRRRWRRGIAARRDKSKEPAGCRRYQGERRGGSDFVELRWGRRASNLHTSRRNGT